MIVYATRFTMKKAAAGLLALAAVIWGVSTLSTRGAEAASVAGQTSLSQKLKTNEDRTNFLQSYGWEIDETPKTETEVRIPDEFDSAYETYNALQKTQGLDLEKYKGRKAMLYAYNVRNDPSGEQGVTANLVLYRNTLIAADISSAQADGFTRTVTEMPTAPSQDTAGTTLPQQQAETPQDAPQAQQQPSQPQDMPQGEAAPGMGIDIEE